MTITFRQDLDVLFCRWRVAVEGPQFTEGYLAALKLALQHRSRFWLHDLRMRNISSEQERSWFIANMSPPAATMAPGIFIAYLMSPLQRQNLVSETKPISEVIHYSPHLHARYFISEHNALEWLEACRLQAVP